MQEKKESLIRLNSWKFIIFMIIFMGSAFYRYDWRPSQIIKKCQSWSIDEGKNRGETDRETALYLFGKCLRQNGLNR
jgi:hypothetical protein